MVLVFGFLYVSWHFGRAYEKGTFDHVAVVNAAQVESVSHCDELIPTDDWNNKHMEFTKR